MRTQRTDSGYFAEFAIPFKTLRYNNNSDSAAPWGMAYNPRLQASVFYQYNSYDRQGRWNARGSWEFAPLSFLYLVFNKTNFSDRHLQNRSVISKISYLKQF